MQQTKNAKKATEVTNPSKTIKGKAKLAVINVAKASKDAKPKIEVKYQYPKDCITKDQRKTFRRKARATRSSFIKTMDKLKASNTRDAKKLLKEKAQEQKTWEQLTLTPIKGAKTVKPSSN